MYSAGVRLSPVISGWVGGEGWMAAAVAGHNLHLWVLSHSTCESLMGGSEGVTALMRLAEEHSLVGWLVAPDRAHRGPQGPAAPHGPLTCGANVSQHTGWRSTLGQRPIQTLVVTPAQAKELSNYRSYTKELRYGWQAFVYVTGIYLE